LNKKLANFLKLLFFLTIGIVLLWFASKDLTEEQSEILFSSLKNANYGYIVLSILFGICSHFIRALRWKNVIDPMGFSVKKSNSFFAVMIGYLVNIAVFRAGELARCGFMARYEKPSIDKLFGTVITERIIDLIFLVIVFGITILIQYDLLIHYFNETIFTAFQDKLANSINSFWLLALLGVFGILAFFILKRFKFFDKLKNFVLGLKDGVLSVGKVKNIPLFIFHSFLIWFFYFLMVYVAFDCLPETAHLGVKAGMAILAFGTIGIVVVQGGIGAYHLIVQGICVLYGIDSAIGLAFAWIIWSAQTLLILIFGFLSFVLMPMLNKEKIAV